MNEQINRLRKIVKILTNEQSQYRNIALTNNESELFRLYRILVNNRPPMEASEEYLALEDAYLQAAISEKGITDTDRFNREISLWQGDITTLEADAIVNAANKKMLGCFVPCHGCIDNAIHTYAGVRLRLACHKWMQEQAHDEPTGGAKITSAFNLPSQYILHTVGPIVTGKWTDQHREDLRRCYRSCLDLATDNGLKSIAFCCISTGEYCFPQQEAAEIAVREVVDFLKTHEIKVVFNVYKDSDFEMYKKLIK